MELLQWQMKLKHGQCVKLERSVIVEAAQSDLSSLLFGTVRQEDIDTVLRQVNRQDDFTIRLNIDQTYTLCRTKPNINLGCYSGLTTKRVN